MIHTNILNNLRVSSNPQEITTILKELYEEGAPVKIWHATENKKIIVEGSIKSLNLVKKYFAMIPTEKKWPSSFTKKITLYFFGESKSIIFKQEKIDFHDNIILAPFPTKISVLEKRRSSRILFDEKQNKKIVFKKNGLLNDKIFEQDLLDVSELGLAFQIPNTIVKFFYIDDIIEVQILGNNHFSPPLKAKIKYVKAIINVENGQQKQNYRIGATFNTETLSQKIQNTI